MLLRALKRLQMGRGDGFGRVLLVLLLLLRWAVVKAAQVRVHLKLGWCSGAAEAGEAGKAEAAEAKVGVVRGVVAAVGGDNLLGLLDLM